MAATSPVTAYPTCCHHIILVLRSVNQQSRGIWMLRQGKVQSIIFHFNLPSSWDVTHVQLSLDYSTSKRPLPPCTDTGPQRNEIDSSEVETAHTKLTSNWNMEWFGGFFPNKNTLCQHESFRQDQKGTPLNIQANNRYPWFPATAPSAAYRRGYPTEAYFALDSTIFQCIHFLE